MRNLILLFFIGWISSSTAQIVQEVEASDYGITLSPGIATVNILGQWELKIVPQIKSIPQGTTIKVRFIKGFDDLQYQNSNNRAYCFTSISTASVEVPITNIAKSQDDHHECWDSDTHNWVVTMKVNNGDIQLLDTLTVSFGGGDIANNVRAHTRIFEDEIKMIFESPNEDTTTRFINMPTIDNQSGPANGLRIVLNSTLNKGDSSLLKLIVLDQFGNPVEDFIGSISLDNPSGGLELPSNVIVLPANYGHLEIPIVGLDNGFHRVNGILLSNSDEFIANGASNFIEVRDSFENHIYWGELHNHSGISRDGVGNRTYYFARYITGLDFFTATEHSTKQEDIYGINSEEWAQLKSEVLFFNEPSVFTTFYGFETSYNAPAGHYNFIFNFEDENFDLIPNMPRGFFPSMSSAWDGLDTLNELLDVITIPHHTGKRFNRFLPSTSVTSFGGSFFKPEYKSSIEIFSTHGLSESFDRNHDLSYSNNNPSAGEENGPHYAQDAWALGEKLGVLASSDNHAGYPAQNNEGVSAVYSSELDRDEVFGAIKSRATYGTTGERMIINFKVDDVSMGGAMTVAYGDKVDLSYSIKGTGPLHKVEVLKWDFTYGEYLGGHPHFEVIYSENYNGTNEDYTSVTFQDSIYTDSCMYYLRVKQQGISGGHEMWGWSSPVWVSAPDAPTAIYQDLNDLLEATLVPTVSSGGQNLNLNIQLTETMPLNLIIYDAAGKWMYRDMFKVSPGTNQQLIPTEYLSKGTYFLSLHSLEKNALLTIPFVVQ